VRGCIVAGWERKMCGGQACVGMKKRGAGLGREKSKPGGGDFLFLAKRGRPAGLKEMSF